MEGIPEYIWERYVFPKLGIVASARLSGVNKYFSGLLKNNREIKQWKLRINNLDLECCVSTAAFEGHVDLLKLLCLGSEDMINDALAGSIVRGHDDCIKFCLLNGPIWWMYAIRIAIIHKRFDTVDLLSKKCPNGMEYAMGCAMGCAGQRGDMEAIKYLAEKGVSYSHAIVYASKCDNESIIRELMPYCKLSDLLETRGEMDSKYYYLIVQKEIAKKRLLTE